ncbi:unnamed protein product [Gongylonema pulchrum]|uniref:G-protein coupled receptors family 1 profile domain-containing protein n=1 Tax=Gongylonema pulchrum TaxID=637853 RepID=A0A3P6NXJ4_9BILA|nr:unnamed protein product [Gongylonema pulchrum]
MHGPRAGATWMPPLQAAHIFGTIFISSGIAAMIFNATILAVLFRLRRSIFSNVFYILIFNFVLIDLLRSICSIVWALKLLPVGISSSMYFMKADQLALMILRFSNLATILNLLMITLNEYIYIVYPLRYRQFVTSSYLSFPYVTFSLRIALLISICWGVAWAFTISILFSGSRKQSIYIKPNCIARMNHLGRTRSTVAFDSSVTHSAHLPSYS